jgi:hypothetical protein
MVDYPEENLMEVATTDGEMYRRAIKNFAGAFKNT